MLMPVAGLNPLRCRIGTMAGMNVKKMLDFRCERDVAEVAMEITSRKPEKTAFATPFHALADLGSRLRQAMSLVPEMSSVALFDGSRGSPDTVNCQGARDAP